MQLSRTGPSEIIDISFQNSFVFVFVRLCVCVCAPVCVCVCVCVCVLCMCINRPFSAFKKTSNKQLNFKDRSKTS